MTDDILTIEEVAKYLRVSDRTVYDWAQKGEIPAGKIGTVWRFKKSEVENWVNAKLSSSSFNQNDSEVQIKNILSPDRIVFINQVLCLMINYFYICVRIIFICDERLKSHKNRSCRTEENLQMACRAVGKKHLNCL